MRTPFNIQIRKEPQTAPLYHIQISSLDNISPTADLIDGISRQSGGLGSANHSMSLRYNEIVYGIFRPEGEIFKPLIQITRELLVVWMELRKLCTFNLLNILKIIIISLPGSPTI